MDNFFVVSQKDVIVIISKSLKVMSISSTSNQFNEVFDILVIESANDTCYFKVITDKGIQYFNCVYKYSEICDDKMITDFKKLVIFKEHIDVVEMNEKLIKVSNYVEFLKRLKCY